ncbi:MAG: glycine cleavage system aminomethyltransferase GcvT [Dehalococcoidia bacterium]|nr:glycine cleavage system aminomethyltransferase GcvT [Dehalococcoidia bacterium]
MKRTPLYGEHTDRGGKLVPFAGWEMPIQFSGILSEVKIVRHSAGIFDVSHMGRLFISGNDAAKLLDLLTTSHIATMPSGKAKYTLLCNENGGIIDDTIIYKYTNNKFLMIPNASNEETIIEWINKYANDLNYDVEINRVTTETVMIALQGPKTTQILQPICSIDLLNMKPFSIIEGDILGYNSIIATTGYTGEMGVEIICNIDYGSAIWSELINLGATPCGLGARDILRIEAGLLLHGSDMNDDITPLEAGLERFVAFDKSTFCGKSIMLDQQEVSISKSLIGFKLEDKGIPRHGYKIYQNNDIIGEVTSGSYSPTLDTGIGLGYVPIEFAKEATELQIDIRGRMAKAKVAPLPFYSKKRSK